MNTQPTIRQSIAAAISRTTLGNDEITVKSHGFESLFQTQPAADFILTPVGAEAITSAVMEAIETAERTTQNTAAPSYPGLSITPESVREYARNVAAENINREAPMNPRMTVAISATDEEIHAQLCIVSDTRFDNEVDRMIEAAIERLYENAASAKRHTTRENILAGLRSAGVIVGERYDRDIVEQMVDLALQA